jgi:hypothetical protein
VIDYGTHKWNAEVTQRPLGADELRRRYSSAEGTWLLPKARIYVWTPDEFDAIATASSPIPVASMFPLLDVRAWDGTKMQGVLWTKRKDFPLIDRAWDRHNRAFVNGQRFVLDAVEHVIGTSDVKYSRKAGCGCGCSAGFIANDLRGESWSVNVTMIGGGSNA